MKRNYHYEVTFTPAPNPNNFGNLNFPVPTATTVAPEHIHPGYHPRTVSVNRPMWNENTAFIHTLEKMFNVSCYNPSYGYAIDSAGLIYNPTTSEEAVTGVISAMAVGVDTTKNSDRVITSGTHIINTEDCGFRYVCPTKDGRMLDLGPVDHTCIVGNNKRPEGVYVPIHNTKAMADGITILKEFFDQATEGDKDLPPFTDNEELPAPDYNHGHKCKCNNGYTCKNNKKK